MSSCDVPPDPSRRKRWSEGILVDEDGRDDGGAHDGDDDGDSGEGDDRGAGLGPSIVRAVVEAHHGRVGLVSRPGVGATFRLVVPVDPP